jgi:hypothetical protein
MVLEDVRRREPEQRYCEVADRRLNISQIRGRNAYGDAGIYSRIRGLGLSRSLQRSYTQLAAALAQEAERTTIR